MTATNSTLAVISLDSIGAACLTYQTVEAQDLTLKATKKAAYGVITGAVSQTVKTDGVYMALRELCGALCIPATIGRLRRIETMKADYPALDWAHLFSNTSEDPMTDDNKTAAYNAVKMAVSRMKKADEKAAENAENAKLTEIAAAEKLEADKVEAARVEAEKLEADKVEAARVEAAAVEAARIANIEQELLELKTAYAALKLDRDTLAEKLAASAKPAKSGKVAAVA